METDRGHLQGHKEEKHLRDWASGSFLIESRINQSKDDSIYKSMDETKWTQQ